MGAKKNRIPVFKSDEEEHAFWAIHSFEEFAADLEDLDIEIRPTRTEQIAIRLSSADLASLRAVAEARGIGHTTLARSIVEAWVRQAAASQSQIPSKQRRATK